MSQEIFVMVEQKEGTIEEPSFSLLSEGKRLNEKMGNPHGLSAIVLGYEMKSLERELGQYGADKAYYFEDRQLKRYQPELYTGLIVDLIKERDPDVFLLGATPLSSDLAPRIAARLRVGLVTQCVDIRVNGGQLEAVKAVSDQYLYQRVAFHKQGLKMVTLSPHVLAKEEPDTNKRAEVIWIRPAIDQEQIRTRFLALIKADPKTVGLEEADVIVCGGRGVGRETFDMIDQLADALNGAVGGTRPIIDWGVLPYERQIGQTGIDVSPTLLLTCGVSGANEFTVGIEGSKLVVSMNIDRRARIFKFADLGIVGDLHKIIPLVIHQNKRHKQNIEKG